MKARSEPEAVELSVVDHLPAEHGMRQIVGIHERGQNMRKLVTRVLAIGVVAVPLTLGTLAVSTSAYADAGSPTAVGITGSTGATALPNSNIKTNKAAAVVFSPTKLSTTWSSATKAKCTKKIAKATIVNTTSSSQTVTLGKSSGTIPAGDGEYLCFYGSGTHVFGVSLTGSTSKLKISVS